MKASIRQKLVLFSLIVLTGSGVLGYAVYERNQKLYNSGQWVQHTEMVIYQSGNILSTAQDIETTSRGFVITGDSTFLKPLYIAKKAIFTNIRQLRQLTIDNHAQQKRIDSLDLYVQKMSGFSLKTVEIRSKQGLAPAVAYISAKQNGNSFDLIRQIIRSIQHEENSLLKSRRAMNARRVNELKQFSRVMFASMVTFIILLLI